MDPCEATKLVFSRIQSLDPENASKIMGYLLLRDHGDKEMIRLAFGPEIVLHNLILQAKSQLGISSNSPSTPTTPSSPSPFKPTSRPNPLSISSSPFSNSWPLSSPNFTSSFSYASIVNGTSNRNTVSASLSNAFTCYGNNNSTNNSNTDDLIDDYHLQDQLSFLNDTKTDDLFGQRLELAMSPTAYVDSHFHGRSFSVPGMCLGAQDVNCGFGWKPCLYFARGFCKNGTSCRFLHGEGDCGSGGNAAPIVGSPRELNEFDQCHEVLRSKAVTQQQKLAAAASQFTAGASFTYDTQRSAATTALLMGDELHKFGRCRPERNDFSPMGLGGAMNAGSRQIYLTFPADSTFREENVSNYFSIYGPVQDVRIPYQQKRMFGFVTFLYPETVKIILAKGNPHFVCNSRVLVKPYKEKGKVAEKKLQLQQMERGEYSACSSPTAPDSREQFDLHLGASMSCNTKEIVLRRTLEEQADLQQAIELQGRRLLNLQLLDHKNHAFNPHQHLHGLYTVSPISSPTFSSTLAANNQRIILPPDVVTKADSKENDSNPGAADASQEAQSTCQDNGGSGNNCDEERISNTRESDLHGCLEHILPDNLFTSPKKSVDDHVTVFSTASVDVDEKTTSPSTSSPNNNPLISATALNMPTLKSCFLQMPRLPSGHEAIGI